MGLLADIFSYGDTQKRRLRGLLDDPAGTLGLGATRAVEDQNGLLGLMDQAGYTPGSNSVLLGNKKKAQTALADKAMESFGGLLGATAPKLTPAERQKAMQDMGYESGWFRGGNKIVDGKKSGDWYTRSVDEAADYAKRLPNADVREYAVPTDTLKSDLGYSPRLAHDLAAKVEGMGAKGAEIAKLLREYGPQDKIPGVEVWRGLSKYIGDDDAMAVLQSLGFKGVRGVNSPDYLRVFPKTVVRDANLAAFNKANAGMDDIYGSATPAFMSLLAGGTLGGLLAADRMKAGGEKTPSLPLSP